MPLIIISGYPSSGKTQRVNVIKEYLAERVEKESKSLHAREEKKARGALLSAVERCLSKDDIVIADALNYIKGFRYQLYCIARGIGTPHCVIQTGVPIDVAKEWNKDRGSEGYDETVFDELVTRYEEPEERNRWDSPLFILLHDDKEIPVDKIWDAVILKKALPPNKSTISKPVSSTNYVYELDKITLDIINAFVDTQKEVGTGGLPMSVPRSSTKVINPCRTITLSELRRIRKQFIIYNKQSTTLDINLIGNVFVGYLNSALE
ncbi:hypothetical protein [Parasitella parasitica]|uniref:Chromatin associated protein KTI12 n=1 Tax=Parasitella parasitica TaxID=35722 RepID=A0A0B7MTP5_9FUNG|nr:hypothetical protein [Parasitella parasitica]